MQETVGRVQALRRRASQLWRDSRGNYAILTALVSPVIIGAAGLATEGGLWMYVHQTLQGAADSAALSAATQYSLNTSASLNNQASSVVASSRPQVLHLRMVNSVVDENTEMANPQALGAAAGGALA